MPTSYSAPTHILEVMQKIDFEEALAPEDPRCVDTRAARGAENTLSILARKLGVSLGDGAFFPRSQCHILFFGHTGSGKTTELRRYQQTLAGSSRYFVVEVNITHELDRMNIEYADVLMAMARALVDRLEAQHLSINPAALQLLEDWFKERVTTEERAKEFIASVETGISAKSGMPFLAELFAKLTTTFRSNASYKDAVRQVVRNTFSQFATAFNAFILAAEESVQQRGLGRRVLFVIDGTDKLRGEDTRRFFVEDAEQLLAIQTMAVYVAPLSMKYERVLTGKLDTDLVLPMVKLELRDGTAFAPGRDAMRDILLRRASHQLFASEAEIERLVTASGGHPRDLLRLLKLACEFAEDNLIDAACVDQALHKLAAEYRRFLETEDYLCLARIDVEDRYSGNDERLRKLLYNLALLEYNDGSWRRSHPVIRLLEGYQLARDKVTAAPRAELV